MTEAQGVQPDGFAFSGPNMDRVRAIIARYPEGRQASAVMPLLDLAQRQSGGWLPHAAMDAVSDMLGMAPIRVYEVATFYTMYNLEPVGDHLVQVCTTTPCALCGSAGIVEACSEELGIGLGETTADNKFTLREAECLGACVNAPMMQIGDDYYEDLDADSARRILQALARGETPAAGSQTGRSGSENGAALTALTGAAGGAGE